MKHISLKELGGMPCLDLSCETEFAAGHLEGAANIPADEIASRLHELPPRGRTLCLMGPRARELAEYLSQPPRWNLFFCEDPLPEDRKVPGPGSRLWESAAWLRKHSSKIRAGGRVIDLAMGSGRNAVYLALEGFEVEGEDILDDAVEAARVLAVRNGVKIRARQGDLTRPDPLPENRYDAVTVFNYLDRSLFPNLQSSLLGGGLLIYETFLEEQALRYERPKNPDFLLKAGELKNAFSSMDILAYEEGEEEEGRVTARLLARKV